MSSSCAVALLALTAVQSAEGLASWGARPFSQANWPWVDVGFNTATINVYKGGKDCVATPSTCVAPNFCNPGPLTNCNLKQGAPSLPSCLGIDKTWLKEPTKWANGKVNNGYSQCGRDWSGTTCCPAGLTPFQADKENITVTIQANVRVTAGATVFDISQKNFRALQQNSSATPAQLPCSFPPVCFNNPNPGSPCPAAGDPTAPLPPTDLIVDGLPITYSNDSNPLASSVFAPLVGYNATAKVSPICCQSAVTPCPKFTAPDFNKTYLQAVGFEVWMCYAKSSLYQRGWRKANADPMKTKACWYAANGNYSWVTTPNPDGSVNASKPLYVTFPLEPTTPQGIYYTRVYILDVNNKRVGFGDSNVTQGYFYVNRYDPLEDGQIHTGAAVMSAFAVVLICSILFWEKRKNMRADNAQMETDVKS